MAKLIFTDKNNAGQVYEFTLEKTTVGRADDNTLVIPDSSLSGHHCEIHVNGAEVIVRDLGSRNGTFVNGLRLVDHQAQLKSGQTVRFGSIEARLELEARAYDDSASDITAVHAMGRIMRDQKREAEHPKPTDPSMKLGASDSSAEGDQTVTAFAPAVPRRAVDPVGPTPSPAEASDSSSKGKLIILAVIVLVLGLAFWWWRRK